MTELKAGDLVFDARGMPVGVVSEVDADQFRCYRHGKVLLPMGALPTGPDLHGVDQRLLDFAARNGLTITSGRDGHHNTGSLHYRGLALDFRSRGLKSAFIAHLGRDADQHGLTLRDERKRPPGQLVWGGPHLHLEVTQ